MKIEIIGEAEEISSFLIEFHKKFVPAKSKVPFSLFGDNDYEKTSDKMSISDSLHSEVKIENKE